MRIEGSRVIIRQLKLEDLENFYSYRSDPQVCRYQTFMVKSKIETEQFIDEQKERALGTPGKWLQIGIEHKKDEKLIGDCAIYFKEDEPRIVEIGYTIHPDYQRNGYATEAVRMLMKTVFKDYNVHKILAKVDVRNPSSARVLEKIGFKQEGRFYQHFYDEKDKAWIDEIQFAYMKEDFMEEIF